MESLIQSKKREIPLICYAGSADRNLDRSKTDGSWIHINDNKPEGFIQELLEAQIHYKVVLGAKFLQTIRRGKIYE